MGFPCVELLLWEVKTSSFFFATQGILHSSSAPWLMAHIQDEASALNSLCIIIFRHSLSDCAVLRILDSYAQLYMLPLLFPLCGLPGCLSLFDLAFHRGSLGINGLLTKCLDSCQQILSKTRRLFIIHMILPPLFPGHAPLLLSLPLPLPSLL